MQNISNHAKKNKDLGEWTTVPSKKSSKNNKKQEPARVKMPVQKGNMASCKQSPDIRSGKEFPSLGDKVSKRADVAGVWGDPTGKPKASPPPGSPGKAAAKDPSVEDWWA